MTKKQRALAAIEALKLAYPNAACSLMYDTPLQLLVATRLSAQCTDARVNLVTGALFEHFPTAEAFAAAQLEDVETDIRSCGLYKTKAKDLIALSKMLCEEYDGIVPDSIEELTKLPGVGRKTANLVCGDIYGKPAIVCDTHCIRITNRLGLTDSKDPLKTENQLRKLLPPNESNAFCHRLVLFGRDTCTARKADCDNCPLAEFCPSAGKAVSPSQNKKKPASATSAKAGRSKAKKPDGHLKETESSVSVAGEMQHAGSPAGKRGSKA